MFINYYYSLSQFSKSRGVGVFGNHCKETAVLPEVWRYYLLTNRPESADTKFLWSDLGAKNNNELLANLGNFCHRTLSFAASRFAGENENARNNT
jgi:methionyl-tRNA synthetase